MEWQRALQSYHQILWSDFPEISLPHGSRSLGKTLLELNRGLDAIPVLLKECFTLHEEAQSELVALYESGWDQQLKPFDKNILTCFESTSADGFVPAKKILTRIYAKGSVSTPTFRKRRLHSKAFRGKTHKPCSMSLGLN
ncbi:MAG: hypothetical protein QM706_09060 [Nitrospira sp.]